MALIVAMIGFFLAKKKNVSMCFEKDSYLRAFKVREWPSSQNASIFYEKFTGAHHLGARVARQFISHIIEKDKKLHNIASYDLARRARGSSRAPFFCTPTCWVDQVYEFWYLYHHHNVKIDETKATQSFSIFRKMSFSTKFFSKNEFSKKNE